MAAPPVLLVADDLSLIAAVKRVLAREGYECVLATNAADAVIAFGHSLPGLVLVQPTVEGDRGAVVLEELQNHPDAQLLRVVLLGDSAPGSSWPIEPTPIEPDHLSKTIATNVRAGEQQWSIREAAPVETPTPPEPAPPGEPDEWRATNPRELSIEDKLFGDMAADIEASAMESVEAALPQVQKDDELQRLEDDVLAEAQRRRASREARAVTVKPARPTPPPAPEIASEGAADEASFADVSDEPAAPPSRAGEVLSRAEAMVLESRAQSDAQLRAEEAELHERAEAEATLTRRLEDSDRLVASLRADIEAHAQEVLRLNAALDESRVNYDVEIDELRGKSQADDSAHASELESLRREFEEAQSTHASELEALRAKLEEAQASHDAELEKLQASADASREEAQRTLERLTGELAEVQAQRAELEAQISEVQTSRVALESKLQGAEQQLNETGARVETLTADLNNTSELMEETSRERDAIRNRVAILEPELAIEKQRVKELEAREVMPVELPGKRTVGLARHGKVGLDGLSRVVSHVVLANLETRLDLGVEGGVRTLFFKRGQIVAAESNLDHENLLTRARRDGLIDSKQEGELRTFRGATPKEQLEALKVRGFIRDIESVPLVQRYTEQVALDAFCEEHSNYRLVDEAPTAATLLATVPRPTLPMLAESLRRAVTPDVLLEKLGGGEAVATPNESELDLRALGFSERERKMLLWVDSEATVEDLSLASGLKPDAAFRALLVAKYLGLIDLKPGTRKTESASGQLDVNRLDAKFDEIQDADYFTILGLPRVAGAEDVRRAYQRLSQEFDPLRYSGHPDAALQQRAQTVSRLLEEAARALEDDRRRADYARHLLD